MSFSLFSYLPSPPDPALRQPYTSSAFFPLVLGHYALAILAILPHTFIFRISLLPIVLWQAWRCAVGLSLSEGVAQLLGLESAERLNYFNVPYMIGVFVIVTRSFDWTFVKKPLRRYEPLAEGQKTLIERPLSPGNVFLDAFELLFNLRGIGWSWSSKPFPYYLSSSPTASPSLTSILLKMIYKFVLFDILVYLVQYLRPSTNDPKGDTLFDPNLSLVPRWALANFFALCGGMIIYTTIDASYHFATLIGRVVLRQSAWQWPPLSDRPWVATSITQFWSFRWHQFFRHIFVVFGARPGGKLLGHPGALMGAFVVSGYMHYIGIWGLGRGTDFFTAGAFFPIMGVGTVVEWGLKKATGLRVGGLLGWTWTMVWTISWGTLMLDGWARRGVIACDFFPYGMRPGKMIVDAIIGLVLI
ncbi:hypothetical protein B0F90DRAFT_1627170 [Multifurca ochricompacta]|uniref:Wax synthase domain-containing protein n=1 Tax=Multifurca ochricompacta TaxID=376703 RepID=A0AAD4M6V6_9AGAM|nr:hypothetical protein B0F90DRAFT_1627170 [Multifurca ochricompacta]